MKNLVNLALIAVCYASNSTNSESEGLRTPIRTRSPSNIGPGTPTTPTDQRIQMRPNILNAPRREQRLYYGNQPEPLNLNDRFPSPMRPRNPTQNQVGQNIPEDQPDPFNYQMWPANVMNAPRLRPVIPDFEPEPFDLNDPVNHGLDINNIIKDEISQNSDDECTICFEQDDRNLVVLNCNHVFHRDWYFYIKVVWKLF